MSRAPVETLTVDKEKEVKPCLAKSNNSFFLPSKRDLRTFVTIRS